jgi:hypothetical protein
MFRTALSAGLIACVCLQAPKTDEKPPVSKPLTAEAIAGEYSAGNAMDGGTTYTLTRDNRFTFCFFSDAGQGLETGTFAIVDGIIEFRVLKVEINRNGDGEPIPHKKMHPIRWGTRIYLIEDSEMARFCMEVNLGSEPESHADGIFHVESIKRKNKDSSEVIEIKSKAKPMGLPDVLGAWKSHLLKKPVEGKITETLPENRAKVDLGSADGLIKGMILLVDHQKVNRDKHPYGIARVLSVEDHSAVVEGLARDSFSDGFEVGWKVRSRIEDKYFGECGRLFDFLEL